MSLHGDTMGHGFKPLVSKIRCWNPNKGGYTKKNYNYMHYIATREGVDLSQINRIEDMVNVNADLNDYGEDLIGKEADNSTYLKYITNRPRSHGLFGNIDTDNFSEVSKKLNEVTKQDRIIFRGIISLSKEDAEALEYTSAEKWNTYLRSVMPDIAKELSVSPNNMTWVAAFHAEANHPHVHYMLWDNRDKVMSPYIHVSRQEACRKICQDAMFTPENEALIRSITEAERKELYMQQNVARNEITSFLKEMYQGDNVPGVVKEILPERTSPEDHKRLNRLYEKILNTMPGSGRIAYKFMPPECKGYIDKVTDILLKRPDIGGQYDVYMKAVGDIHRVLGKTSREISKEMTSAKEDLYNRTGNIILQSVCCLKEQILGDKESVYADFIYPDPEEAENIDLTDSNENDFEEDYDDSEEEKDNPLKEEKKFREIVNNSSSEIRDNWYTEEARIALSEVYLEEQDYDAALKVLTEPEQKDEKGRIAIQEAKIHLSLGDIPEAMRYYDKAVEKGNLTGRYYQSKIYSTNDYGVYDITKALLYMREAAEADIFVAKAGVAKLYLREDAYNPKLAYDQLHRVLAEFQTKELCNDLSKSELRQRASIYEILGDLHKDKNCIYYDCEKSVEYYNKALVDNQDAVTARLSMAKIYSDIRNQENGHYNLSFAMKQLQLLDTLNNKDIDRNYDRIQMAISRIYADKNYEGCDYGKALSALDKIQSDEKGFIDLQRGNIYAVENSPYYDMKKAVACYTSAAQKNNTNAMVKLAKCYLYGLGVDRDKEAAKLWLQEADQRGDEYAREYLKNIDRTSYNPITYTLVKQLLNSLAQSKDKKVQQLREQEFKSQSKQAKKEQYLHRN